MTPTLRPYNYVVATYHEPKPKQDQVGNEATRLTHEAADTFRAMAKAKYLPQPGPDMPPLPKK